MLEPKNSNVAILNAIERSLINAARNFELAANGLAGTMDWAAYRMPEYCIVSMLMQDLQQMGVAAFPEVRISHDLEEAVKGIISGGQKMSSARYPLLKGCKIDLFAFDYSGAEGSPVHRPTAVFPSDHHAAAQRSIEFPQVQVGAGARQGAEHRYHEFRR